MNLTNPVLAHAYNNLLPDYISNERDCEMQEWKKQIFEHLPEILTSKDHQFNEFWLGVLDTYTTNETFSLTMEELEKIVAILYEFITTTKNYANIIAASNIVTSIVNPKRHRFTTVLPWRPLYDILYKCMISRTKFKIEKFPSKLPETLISLADTCRNYFEPESTEEMLKEWLPMLDPHHPSFVLSHCLLSSFLPLTHNKHSQWLPRFIDFWTLFHSVPYDYHFFLMLSTLSYLPQSSVPWENILPLLVNTMCFHIGLPSPLVSTGIPSTTSYQEDLFAPFFSEVHSFIDLMDLFATIVVNLLTGDIRDLTRKLISHVLFLISPFCSPSAHSDDEQQCEAPLALLTELVVAFSKRVREERKYGPKLLELDDMEWFVNMTLPLIVTNQFCEEPEFLEIGIYSQLYPSLTVKPLLEVASHSLGIVHLKPAGLRLLLALAPTVLVTGEEKREFMRVAKLCVDDIDFADVQKTSSVMALYTVIASHTTFSDEDEIFCIRAAEKSILFAEHAVGEDYEESLGELCSMLSAIIRTAPSKVPSRVATMIFKRMDDIPDGALSCLLEALGDHAKATFVQSALGTNKKALLLMKILARMPNPFFTECLEKFKESIETGLRNDSKKKRFAAAAALKWALKNLLSTYPYFPEKVGLVDIRKVKMEWHIPSGSDIELSEIYIDYFTNIAETLLSSSTQADQLTGAYLARGIVKGMSPGLSAFDLEIDPSREQFIQPPLKVFSASSLGKRWERVCRLLVDSLKTVSRPTINHILKIFNLADAPRDPAGFSAEGIGNEYTFHSDSVRVKVLKPSMGSQTYSSYYWKAQHIYATRLSLVQVPLPLLTIDIVNSAFEFVSSPSNKTRIAAASFIVTTISRYQNRFFPFLSSVVMKAEEAKGHAYSGMCEVLAAIATLPICFQTLELLFASARLLCRRLSADKEEDSARALRQLVVTLFDQINLAEISPPEGSTDKGFLNMRESLSAEAVKTAEIHKASHETTSYAAALVCSVLISEPLLIDPSSTRTLIELLSSESQVIRDCAVGILPSLIELLIPRVDSPNRQKFDSINADNYDRYLFNDKPMPNQSKREPLFMTREQLLNPTFIGTFFDNPEKRVEVHKIIIEYFMDDSGSYITKMLNLNVDAQIQKEETFSKPQVILWCSLCRFLGYEFSEILFKTCLTVSKGDATSASQILLAEVFSGILHSIKTRPFEYVKRIENLIGDHVTSLFTELEPEFHSLWYFAFFASYDRLDPARFFWVFERVQSSVPLVDSVRSARSASLAADILIEASKRLPQISMEVIEGLVFSLRDFLEYEQIRECMVRAIVSLLKWHFVTEERGNNKKCYSLLKKLMDGTPEIFETRVIAAIYRNQSLSSLSIGGFALERIERWSQGVINRDEDEERLSRTALSGLISSNWIGSLGGHNFTVKGAKDIIKKVIKFLVNNDRVWQVQTVMLLLLETFIATTFVYIEEDLLDDLVKNTVIPGLQNQHPDVQDAASQLLIFLIRSFESFSEKISDYVDMFSGFLFDSDSHSKRIAGAKGLSSLILGTNLFDNVPQYVLDSFGKLTEALDTDPSVEQQISQFMAEFWAAYDDNLTEVANEMLAPYRSSLRPCYIA